MASCQRHRGTAAQACTCCTKLSGCWGSANTVDLKPLGKQCEMTLCQGNAPKLDAHKCTPRHLQKERKGIQGLRPGVPVWTTRKQRACRGPCTPGTERKCTHAHTFVHYFMKQIMLVCLLFDIPYDFITRHHMSFASLTSSLAAVVMGKGVMSEWARPFRLRMICWTPIRQGQIMLLI